MACRYQPLPSAAPPRMNKQGSAHAVWTTPAARWACVEQTEQRVASAWVLSTHPPSSGDHPLLVDEAGETIGSS